MSSKLNQGGKADEVSYQWERINKVGLDKTYRNISWYIRLLNIVLERMTRKKFLDISETGIVALKFEEVC